MNFSFLKDGPIRCVRPEDASGVLAIYGPLIEHSPITFEIEVPSQDEMAERIRGITEKYPWLGYEVDGELAGYAYASSHRVRAAYRWTAEISVYVGQKFHRRGIARKLYETLLPILKTQGYHTLLAGITLPNPASIALHEAFGMKPIGVYHEIGFKAGSWHDVGWWELHFKDTENPPREPRSWSS